MLTAIELCVNPGFYSLHPLFTLLLSNNSSIFNDTDTTLAISVTHNAIVLTKLKTSLFKGRHYIFAAHVVAVDSYVESLCRQFIWANFSVIIKALGHA